MIKHGLFVYLCMGPETCVLQTENFNKKWQMDLLFNLTSKEWEIILKLGESEAMQNKQKWNEMKCYKERC